MPAPPRGAPARSGTRFSSPRAAVAEAMWLTPDAPARRHARRPCSMPGGSTTMNAASHCEHVCDSNAACGTTRTIRPGSNLLAARKAWIAS